MRAQRVSEHPPPRPGLVLRVCLSSAPWKERHGTCKVPLPGNSVRAEPSPQPVQLLRVTLHPLGHPSTAPWASPGKDGSPRGCVLQSHLQGRGQKTRSNLPKAETMRKSVEGEDQEIVFRNIRHRPARSG